MLVDSVISISDLVLQSEHAGIILEVLPTEYESIMTFVYNKSKPIQVDDVELLLLAHESCIEKVHKQSLGTVNITECNPNSTPNSTLSQSQLVLLSAENVSDPLVHLTQTSNGANNNNDAYNGTNQYNTSSRGGGQSFSRDARGGGHDHGGGHDKYVDAQCQVCHKFGREASFS